MATTVTTFKANTAPFNAKMDQTIKKLSKVRTAAMKTASKVGKSMSGFVIGGLGATAIIAGARAVGEFADEVDNLGKSAKRAGMNVEDFQRLINVGEFNDVDSEQVTKAIVNIDDAIGKANEGLTSYTRAFKNLGINVDEFSTLTPTDRVIALATAFQKAQKSGDGMTDVLTILGKGAGKSMLPLLKQDVNDLSKAIQHATYINESHIASVERANDAWARLKQRVKGHVADQLGGFLDVPENWDEMGAYAANSLKYMTGFLGAAVVAHTGDTRSDRADKDKAAQAERNIEKAKLRAKALAKIQEQLKQAGLKYGRTFTQLSEIGVWEKHLVKYSEDAVKGFIKLRDYTMDQLPVLEQLKAARKELKVLEAADMEPLKVAEKKIAVMKLEVKAAEELAKAKEEDEKASKKASDLIIANAKKVKDAYMEVYKVVQAMNLAHHTFTPGSATVTSLGRIGGTQGGRAPERLSAILKTGNQFLKDIKANTAKPQLQRLR